MLIFSYRYVFIIILFYRFSKTYTHLSNGGGLLLLFITIIQLLGRKTKYFCNFFLVNAEAIHAKTVLVTECIGNIILVNGFNYTRCGEVIQFLGTIHVPINIRYYVLGHIVCCLIVTYILYNFYLEFSNERLYFFHSLLQCCKSINITKHVT